MSLPAPPRRASRRARHLLAAPGRARLAVLTALALALGSGGVALGAGTTPLRAPGPVAASAPAPAATSVIRKIVWGIDDQHIALFSDPRWRALPLRNVRYFVPWDLVHEPHYLHLADHYLIQAGRSGTVPLIAITQSDIRGRSRYLPSAAQYRRAVHWMMHRFWWIREWTPWNEANLLNQATVHDPVRAATYWRIARSLCRHCTVTSPSLVGYHLASPKWMRSFLRAARGLRGPWAIHIYNDINEFNLYALATLERELPPGPIWVTEVGGWVRFVGYPPNLSRQRRAEQFLFKVARTTYPRISRWYLYQWFASARSDRWDSGLLNSNGTARPALKVVQQNLLG